MGRGDNQRLPAGSLYAIEAAHMCARAAWLAPEDDTQRQNAVVACQNLNIDYISALASLMESTNCDANVARRVLAEALRGAADQCFAEHGLTTRDAV